MQTITIIVSGKVQGVWYRQSTKEIANKLGISGEVCNLQNGSVSITVTGTKEELERLVDWCRKGPEKASVNEIEVQDISFKKFVGFSIVRG